ncbi:hypothetical protein Bca52824_026898 [Brassica carinata]|uniref:RING-type domain-containing protein n=1 Tax=Brassica carinata TaxID=52824 RepID=A0A8X7SK80_BRACI|nr:hypothetical protein Bca52824_026898 [Brassica carinata]
MIDASLLDCYLCSQRLTAPIIQCTDGHYFCDSCNDGQYNKCPVCFKYISDNRCRAMERILDSAHQCPNASPNPNSRNRFSNRFRNRSIQPVPDLVYEISDDDDDSANPAGDPNAEIWFYRYPLGGRTHGPFSLAKLRNYEDYFSHVPVLLDSSEALTSTDCSEAFQESSEASQSTDYSEAFPETDCLEDSQSRDCSSLSSPSILYG